MNYLDNVIVGLKCAFHRWQLKKEIRAKGGRISGNVKITASGKFVYGKNLYLNGGGITTAKRMQIVVGSEGMLSFGNYSGISSSSIYCKKGISIGNHVNIGAECIIIDSDFHSTNWQDRAFRNNDVQNARSAPIYIGDYVFIGVRCIILKGVTIGEKSIIMAGSVVSKDIPANCIAGGNPCRVLKQLL